MRCVQFLSTLGLLLLVRLSAAAEAPIDYTRDIKPILSNNCYTCHGPDDKTRKGGLRLDVREQAIENAIVPKDAKASPLLERIVSQEPSQVMPPPKSKKPRLTAAQVDLLRRWIDQGAKYDTHWAYVKPVQVTPPAVANPSWVRNPIDQFVAAKHQTLGYTAAAEADRITLIRRLTFDLTGLPPTPAEVDAFVQDRDPRAYEKLVDRLLSSQHFGERMAVYWLDLVRYADTGGYHSDNHRDIALYRDYVIEAFNRNKPFDQFTIEQLAGDLLPNPTSQQKIASGYNRLLMTTEEGGAQPKEYTAKYAADRVRNFSMVWMGATMGCCECHSHKFDPYTIKDFYRMAAFFADVQERAVGRQDQTPIPTPAQETQLKELDARLAAVLQKLATTDLKAGQTAWEIKTRAELDKTGSIWQILQPTQLTSSGGARLKVLEDQSVLTTGKNPAKDVYSITLPAGLKKLSALRLETLRHPSLANGSLSRANGNFVLTEVVVQVNGKPVKIARAEADFAQEGHPVALAIDGNPATGWAVNGHVSAADHQALFVLENALELDPKATVIVQLKHESIYGQHNIGRFRLAATSSDMPHLKDQGMPASVVDALRTPAEKRSAVQQQTLAGHYRGVAPELAPQREEVARLQAEREALVKSFPLTLISMSGAPRMMRVLPRGNWLDDSGEVVTPGTPAFLTTEEPGGRATRLDLAKWLLEANNPLTARVFVNRLWKLYFGQGIVKSVDDFGGQGTMPTHPELLDHLALEFRAKGWDIKHMVKLIVLSNTYRQSSKPTRDLRERDPTNQWLARQGRHRLDAEFIRDNALAISGLLSTRVGGTSVKPYQPAGYWSYLNFPTRDWIYDKGDEQYRRGLYTYWCRSFPHPSLVAFDAPSREECTAERPRSSTPIQALVLLNDPSYVEAARVFAARILQEGGTDTPARLDYAFRRAVSRSIQPAELKVLSDLLARHLAEYRADPKAAAELLKVGQAPIPERLEVAELAAWTSVARVILNLHETITRN